MKDPISPGAGVEPHQGGLWGLGALWPAVSPVAWGLPSCLGGQGSQSSAWEEAVVVSTMLVMTSEHLSVLSLCFKKYLRTFWVVLDSNLVPHFFTFIGFIIQQQGDKNWTKLLAKMTKFKVRKMSVYLFIFFKLNFLMTTVIEKKKNQTQHCHSNRLFGVRTWLNKLVGFVLCTLKKLLMAKQLTSNTDEKLLCV